MTEFVPWPKITRLRAARMAILEKIDGTNGAIHVHQAATKFEGSEAQLGEPFVAAVQSRKRIITPESDNASFAAWVTETPNLAEALGPGVHFGEWAGPKVQKNPLGLDERCFFLFEWFKWPEERLATAQALVPQLRVVPVLFEGEYDPLAIQAVMNSLRLVGSRAVPHAAAAEGIVIHLGGTMFKMTFCQDDHKWKLDS